MIKNRTNVTKKMATANLPTEWVEDYQLEKIFPKHYFPYLKVLHFPAGTDICQQGQELTGIFYIVSGKIKIVRRLFNGKEHILAIQDKPTLIGDIELLTNQTVVSSVTTLENTWCLQLPLTNKKAELLSDPLFLLKLGQGLAQALYTQNIRAATNISYGVKERLATHILAIEHHGQFQLELTTLADSFGISYRHLLRVISRFVKEGVIIKDKPHYHIANWQQLTQWAIQD